MPTSSEMASRITRRRTARQPRGGISPGRPACRPLRWSSAEKRPTSSAPKTSSRGSCGPVPWSGGAERTGGVTTVVKTARRIAEAAIYASAVSRLCCPVPWSFQSRWPVPPHSTRGQARKQRLEYKIQENDHDERYTHQPHDNCRHWFLLRLRIHANSRQDFSSMEARQHTYKGDSNFTANGRDD